MRDPLEGEEERAEEEGEGEEDGGEEEKWMKIEGEE
jgi:hypothetical protein